MILLDSNILIYASKADDPNNPAVIATQYDSVALSEISRLEVLGYHGLKGNEKSDLEQMIQRMRVLPINSLLIDSAIALRQQKSISLGDAIIAATAIEHGISIVTRNTADFQWIDGLKVVNPFDTPPYEH